MSGEPVLAIGELLWDVFPDAERLGGAPFNVVANLVRLGHPALLATGVGADERGRRAIAAVQRAGVATDLIEIVPDLPTGTARVTVGVAGGPQFEIVSPAAYERLVLAGGVLERGDEWQPQALVYGTLAQRSPSVLAATRRISAADGLRERLYDVNLRPGCWSPELVRSLLPLATVVKLNDAEARAVAGTVGSDGSPEALGERLAEDYGVAAVCVTRGANGAALWLQGTLSEAPAIPVAVADTVGAGDAFAAGLLHGLLERQEPPAILDLATRLGALVASRPGAVPDWHAGDLARLGAV